jgi:hypothetical protein
VLEPDEPLRSARLAFYAGMNALTDALSAHAPPACSITVSWPGAIHVDSGLVGGGRLAWPRQASDEEVPDWIVFGASIRTVCMDKDRSGVPLAAALEDQGFSNLGADRLVSSFARHLMSNIDAWQSAGFEVIARKYARRLDSRRGATSRIAPNGDFLLQWPGMREPERHSLSEALHCASRLDANSKAQA